MPGKPGTSSVSSTTGASGAGSVSSVDTRTVEREAGPSSAESHSVSDTGRTGRAETGGRGETSGTAVAERSPSGVTESPERPSPVRTAGADTSGTERTAAPVSEGSEELGGTRRQRERGEESIPIMQSIRDGDQASGAERLPFERREEGHPPSWDGGQIVRHLGQFDDDAGSTPSDPVRCAAASTLAPHILRGPEATGEVARSLDTRVARNRRRHPEDSRTTEEVSRDNQLLGKIRERIDRGESTYGDMSRLQEIMYRSAGGQPRESVAAGGGLDQSQINWLQERTSPERDTEGRGRVSIPDSEAERPQAIRDRLHEGENFVMAVDMPSDRDSTRDHAVVVGTGRDGRRYVYDPGETHGSPVVYDDPGRSNDYYDWYFSGERNARATGHVYTSQYRDRPIFESSGGGGSTDTIPVGGTPDSTPSSPSVPPSPSAPASPSSSTPPVPSITSSPSGPTSPSDPASLSPSGPPSPSDEGATPEFPHGRPVDHPGRPEYIREGPRTATDSAPLFQGDRWQGEQVLRDLGQRDHDPNTLARSDENRCAASSMLAPVILRGPESVTQLTHNLERNGHLSPEDRASLGGIRERIDSRTATAHDMNLLQDIMYRSSGGRGERSFGTPQMQELQRQMGTGMTEHSPSPPSSRSISEGGRTYEDPSRTGERMERLERGQSFLMGVDTTTSSRADENTIGRVNHAVTAGRSPEGRLYVYDPMPRRNQPHIVFQDENPQAFEFYTQRMGMRTDVPTDSEHSDSPTLRDRTGTESRRYNVLYSGIMSN